MMFCKPQRCRVFALHSAWRRGQKKDLPVGSSHPRKGILLMTSNSLHQNRITADEALQRLMDGNAKFVRGGLRFPSVPGGVFAELAKQQHPYATILGCSDSRVPPELI